jgi:predicted N-acetyltransferase YhbS
MPAAFQAKCIATMDHKQSSVTIRLLEEDDVETVHELLKTAFAAVPESDQSEPDLVRRLREDPVYIPDLELVAEMDQKVVGHILLTRVQIGHGQPAKEALALAPVSVVPDLQGRGIGAALIREGHRRATELGYSLIVLVGHPDYYPRFGYQRASDHRIMVSFPAPEEAVMVHELVPGALDEYEGTIRFAKAFGL